MKALFLLLALIQHPITDGWTAPKPLENQIGVCAEYHYSKGVVDSANVNPCTMTGNASNTTYHINGSLQNNLVDVQLTAPQQGPTPEATRRMVKALYTQEMIDAIENSQKVIVCNKVKWLTPACQKLAPSIMQYLNEHKEPQQK